MIKWRPKQKEAIQSAIEAFESGYRNVLIDAPTGSGKSLINYVVARYFGTAFYTTPQVILLEQLEKDKLIDIAVVKGRSNYPCMVEPRKTAANAICRRRRGFACYEECPYRVARANALDSPISAMSFAYLIYDSFLPEEIRFEDRELIIVDEGDDLEGWADDFGSFKFRVTQEFDDIGDVVKWAKATLKNVSEKIYELECRDMEDNDLVEYERLRKYMIKLMNFLRRVEHNKKNWIFKVSEVSSDKWYDAGKYTLEVRPINVGEILNELVWRRGEFRLVSSATIIDRKMFCRTTGLRIKDTFMIKMGSIFPVENRRIYYKPVAKMTVGVREGNYGKIADEIVDIVSKYKGMRGLIQCHSYEIADEVFRRLRGRFSVGIHSSKNRSKRFRDWLRGRFDVFVSVGFNRGVDLKYDLCRFNIIVKCPYPDTKDLRVNELLNNRKAWNWYRYQAIKNLVQAYGRGVRAEDDWCDTYILDSSFGYLRRYKRQIPKWFDEAVVEVKS